MEPAQLALLAFVASLAGAVNSIAGGGTLLLYPVAIAAGLPPIAATASSITALCPGALSAAWAYRKELKGRSKIVAMLAPPAIVGGLGGALLLSRVPERVFEASVPFMVLFGTLLILFKDVVWRQSNRPRGRLNTRQVWILAFAVCAVSVYSGYFGAGKNILMLALLSIAQSRSIHETNALKCAVIGLATSGASIYFLATGKAQLATVSVIAIGAVAGSYGGAHLARGLKPILVRYAVVAIGISLTCVLAYRHLGA